MFLVGKTQAVLVFIFFILFFKKCVCATAAGVIQVIIDHLDVLYCSYGLAFSYPSIDFLLLGISRDKFSKHTWAD